MPCVTAFYMYAREPLDWEPTEVETHPYIPYGQNKTTIPTSLPHPKYDQCCIETLVILKNSIHTCVPCCSKKCGVMQPQSPPIYKEICTGFTLSQHQRVRKGCRFDIVSKFPSIHSKAVRHGFFTSEAQKVFELSLKVSGIMFSRM